MPSDWHAPAFRFRVKASWEQPAGASAVLRLPPDTGSNSVVSAYDQSGRSLAARLIASTADADWAWVTLPRNPGAGDWLWVYYGATDDAPPPGGPVSVRDAKPWRVDVYPVAGVGIPDRWERMQFMRRQTGRRSDRLFFDVLELLRRPQIESNRALLEARTYLHVRDAGIYHFALECRHAAFLLLDDDLVCQWPGEGSSGDWIIGDGIALQPGVYALTVLNSYSRTARHPLRVGWRPPEGPPAPVPIPETNLLAASRLEPIRTESRDRVLHPGFRVSQQPAYRLRDAAPTFVPLVFEAASAHWGEGDLSHTWFFGDGTVAQGLRIEHTVSDPGPLSVELRLDDTLGNETSVTREIQILPTRLREHRLEAGVTRIPAIVFDDDRINPQLDIFGEFGERSVDVEWHIRFHDQTSRTDAIQVIPQAETTVSIPLAQGLRADRVASISWRMSHAGACLVKERVSLRMPESGTRPGRIASHRMWDADGERFVWVTARRPQWRADRRTPAHGAHDTARRPARWLTDVPAVFPEHSAVIVQPARDWTAVPGVAGPMVKILDVMDALEERPRLLMLGVGHADYIQGMHVNDFQRQIGALTDWILAQENQALIWSTPVPLDDDSEGIRPFASAIRRVADVRGVPVLDLYSYFMGASDDDAVWMKPAPVLGLSAEGIETVWRLVLEAMNR